MADRFYQTNLDHGEARVYLPENLSVPDVDYLEAYFVLILKQCRRRQVEEK